MPRDLFAPQAAGPRDLFAPVQAPEVPPTGAELGQFGQQLAQQQRESIFPRVAPVPFTPSAPELRQRPEDGQDYEASFGTQFKAGIVEEPTTKAKIFAKELKEKFFKGTDVSEEDIALRNIQMIDGKMSFSPGRDPETGQTVYYALQPDGFLSTAKTIAAEALAETPAMVLGTTLATAGALSPVPGGAYGGAALGAAGGAGIRKAVGALIFEEPQTVAGNLSKVAQEAAWGVAGEGFGSAVGKIFKRGKMEDMPDARADKLYTLAQEHGIDLGPAEMTGLKRLLEMQKILAQSPETADTVQKFLENREGQIQSAVYKLFADVSGEQEPYAAFVSGQKALKGHLKKLEEIRSSQSGPLYKAAEENQVKPADTRSMLATLDEQMANAKGGNRKAIKAVRALLYDAGGDADTSVVGLHEAKLELDQLIDGARRGTGSAANLRLRTLVGAKQDLLNIIEDSSPDYGAARQRFAALSKPINQLENRLAGKLMKLDDDDAQRFGQTLFGSASSPASVRNTMKLIRDTDPEAADAVTRGYLQSVFERTLGETEGAVASKFRKKIMGSKLNRRMLRAAMTPKQYKNFGGLMEVLEATTRASALNSATATRGPIVEQMGRGAAAKGAAIMKNIATGGIAAFNQMITRLNDIERGRRFEQFAELLTKPMTMKQLKKEKLLFTKLDPSDSRFIPTLGVITGILGGDETMTLHWEAKRGDAKKKR